MRLLCSIKNHPPDEQSMKRFALTRTRFSTFAWLSVVVLIVVGSGCTAMSRGGGMLNVGKAIEDERIRTAALQDDGFPPAALVGAEASDR